jgi:hypothetical protein
MSGAHGGLRNGQARKDTTSQHKRNGNAQIEDQTGILLRELFLGERVDDAAKGQGNSLDNGRKGVEEADQQHVDACNAGRREAIGGAGARTSGADGRGHSCNRHLGAGR